MSLRKSFITFILFFAMLVLSSASFAKEVKKDMHDVLKEVDAKIQIALDAIPAGNAQEVSQLLKAVTETTVELSANYKFEFERDKAQAKLKKARDAAKKADLSTAEQELKSARESFSNLKNFL